MSFKKGVFLISWHFPPCKASSGLNFFKRIKNANCFFDVVQIKGSDAFNKLWIFNSATATFYKNEIEMEVQNSRNIQSRNTFIRNAIESFEKLNQKRHYFCLMSHSHEFVSHLAALEIKQKYPELPWIASFGDPVGANPYNDSYKFDLLDQDTASEREVLALADHVVVTNDYQKRLMLMHDGRRELENKFCLLPHSFDPFMFLPTYSWPKKFTFSHVGMLYKYKRSSKPIVEAAQKLVEMYPEYQPKFVIDFYGAQDKYIQEYIEANPNGNICFHGVVDYLKSLQVMQQSDALLIRDADFSDQGLLYSPFFPGKLADYMGAKKPLIAVTMEDGFVSDLFNRINMHWTHEDNTLELATIFKRCIDGDIEYRSPDLCEFTCVTSGKRLDTLLSSVQKKKCILFAGHMLQFANEIIEYYKNLNDYEVLIDKWNGHMQHDKDISKALLNRADVIFCEWGLGNAVWYSMHKKEGQKLIVRMHLQEIETDFPNRINFDNVDYFIIIAPFMYEKFIRKFNLPRAKVRMIYNLVNIDQFDRKKDVNSKFHIGLLGFVPYRKRMDLALDLLEKIFKNDNRFFLHLKGKKPEEYKWMVGRAEEMQFYLRQKERIESSDWKEQLIYEDFGEDVPEFMNRMGWILSMSDFESFHLAIAEGMAAGCVPVIRNWEGANIIYPSRFIFPSIDEMADFILTSSVPSQAEDSKAYAATHFSADRNLLLIDSLVSD